MGKTKKEEVDAVQELVEILARLRAPDGCPWDREQTHTSLKRFIVEETAELLDAIDEGNDDAIVDELGDVLLQVVLHSQIGKEEGRFDLQQVAKRCSEKMVRRHPHVFGTASVQDAAGVVDQWEKIKKGEKIAGARKSAVSGVPRHLPALHRADKIQRKAAKVGFNWPSVDGVLAKIEEELAEVRQALRDEDEQAISEEIGDLLFSVVNLSRFRRHSAEELLHNTIKKFERRFVRIESLLEAEGRRPEDCSLEELDRLWDHVKAERANF